MERWDDLRYLVAVKKAGTMSGAARLLGANVGTVSRRIERLGSDLGVQPFLKTPEGWQSNPALDGLIEAATDFENRITVEMHRELSEVAPRLVPMKINCPPLISSLFLFPGLPSLREIAPEIQLTVTHTIFNTALGDNDLIVTTNLPERGRLLTRKIGTLSFGVYGPKGKPDTTDWLGLHGDFDTMPPMSLCFDLFNRPPVLRLENFYFVADAMQETGLCGPLPDLMAKKSGAFDRFGDEESSSSVDAYLCYHETRRGDPAIETLSNWIKDCFAEVGVAT